MTPEQLFEAALAKVESASIRAWAGDNVRNREIWIATAKNAIDTKGTWCGHSLIEPAAFGGYIVATAIGL